MLRRASIALLGLVMLLNVTASACSVPSPMFINNYIAAVNSYVHTTDGVTFNNGGNVSFPISLYVKVTKIYSTGGVVPIPITNLKLQYKVKTPTDGAWGADWTDCKSIDDPDWQVDFEDGPVALFGKNVVDIPDLPAGSEILIRVWMSTGLYRNADPADDTDDTGVNGWGQEYVVRVVFDGHRKPK